MYFLQIMPTAVPTTSPPSGSLHTRHRAAPAIAAAVSLALLGSGLAWWIRHKNTPTKTPVWKVQVVRTYPHDPEAFTQGLTWDGADLIEGTGKTTKSEIRRVELPSGHITLRRKLPEDWFGEGVAIAEDSVYQLTWKQGVALVYDRASLQKVREVRYEGQGWGITYDGTSLITSDGTSTLKFRDRESFRVTREIKVQDGNWPVSKLNELEFVDGSIYANVWYRDRIAVIRPSDGQVTAWIDVSQLEPNRGRDAVANGIAYHPKTKRLILTGKNWAHYYEVTVQH